MIKFDENSDEVLNAFRLYQQATRKSGTDIVNRIGRNAAFAAMKELPLVKASSITKHNPNRKRGKSKLTRLHYAKHAKRVPKGRGINAEATKSFNSSKSSRGFLKALFIEIAKDFGAKSKKTTRAGGQASKSKAWLAKINNPVAKMKTGKMEPEQREIVKEAYNRGLRHVARDMSEYALKKLRRDAAKYSGK